MLDPHQDKAEAVICVLKPFLNITTNSPQYDPALDSSPRMPLSSKAMPAPSTATTPFKLIMRGLPLPGRMLRRPHNPRSCISKPALGSPGFTSNPSPHDFSATAIVKKD